MPYCCVHSVEAPTHGSQACHNQSASPDPLPTTALSSLHSLGSMQHLQTLRLELIPYTYKLVLATPNAPAAVAGALGLTAASDWPNASFAEVAPRIAALLLEEPSLEEWHRLIVSRATRRIIGEIGFKYLPREGATEVGYGICPSARGRGLATEALRAMCNFAFAKGVNAIHADCLWENLASAAVLHRAGFVEVQSNPQLRQWRKDALNGAELLPPNT